MAPGLYNVHFVVVISDVERSVVLSVGDLLVGRIYPEDGRLLGRITGSRMPRRRIVTVIGGPEDPTRLGRCRERSETG